MVIANKACGDYYKYKQLQYQVSGAGGDDYKHNSYGAGGELVIVAITPTLYGAGGG